MSATGYTRQSASQISSGQPVASTPINNEFNALVSTFSTTGGHNHDGSTTGCGPTLTSAALTGLTSTASGMVAGDGTGNFAVRTITGTSGKITVTNGTGVSANPTITIDAAYIGQATITTLGTITSGTWNGSLLTGTYGGTGVNNGANTLTLGGNISTAGAFTTSGAFGITLIASGTTSVTLPTSGTLITSSVTSLSSLNTVGVISSGTWHGTAVGVQYGGTGADLSGTGGTSNVLKQTVLGGAVTVGLLTINDINTSQTGTGNIVLQTSPTLITPTLGVATATSINKMAITAPATSSTLTVVDGKTLTVNNSITLAGTDNQTITFQGTDTYIGRSTTDTLTNKTFDTAGSGNVLKINGTTVSSVTGSGAVVLAASPTHTGTANFTNIAASGSIQLNSHGVITEVITQVFTSSGTYTPTSGMVYCVIECVGGGGAGGGVASSSATGAASGGGGGGYSKKISTASSIGASKTVTIGAGGTAGAAGNNPGGNGGDTSVGVLCVAKGGTGGAGAPANLTSGSVPNGGAAGTGDVTIQGQVGFYGLAQPAGWGGKGGASVYGFGGGEQLSPANGNAGQNYGGGGGGALDAASGGNRSGGAGGNGIVIVTEYVSA